MCHHLTPICGVFLSAVLKFLSIGSQPSSSGLFPGFVLTGGLVLVGVIFDSRTEKVQKLFGGLLLKLALFIFVVCGFAIWHYLDCTNRLIHSTSAKETSSCDCYR